MSAPEGEMPPVEDLPAILEPRGSLLDAVQNPALRRVPGVYLLRCRECGHVLYIGQAVDLRGRLATHAFIPPYGAVDIVYGDVLLPRARDRFCIHLKALSNKPRPEVVRFLLAEAEIVHPSNERDRREAGLFSRHPTAFGNRARIWASTDAGDSVSYYLQKGAGYLVSLSALAGSERLGEGDEEDR